MSKYSFAKTDLNCLLIGLLAFYPILLFSLSFKSIKSKIISLILTSIGVIIIGFYPIAIYAMAQPSKHITNTWILNNNYEVTYGTIQYWAGPGNKEYFLDHYFFFKFFKKEVARSRAIKKGNEKNCDVYLYGKNRVFTFNRCNNSLVISE